MGALHDMAQRSVNLRVVLEAAGQYVKSTALTAFNKQARGNIKWDERAVPNMLGILEDLQAGKRPTDNRWRGRPAGINTGATKQSITYRAYYDSVEIGAYTPYASDLQRGGPRVVPITDQLKVAMIAYMKTLRGARRVTFMIRAWAAINKGVWTAKVAPRPFLLLEPRDIANFQKYLRVWIVTGRALKGRP